MNPTVKASKPKKKPAAKKPKSHKPAAHHATPVHRKPETKHTEPEVQQVAHVEPHQEKKIEAETGKPYFYAIGRRKTAMAKVRLLEGDGTVMVNNRKFSEYFPTSDLQKIITLPLSLLGLEKQIAIISHVSGGGTHAQAEALRHGITRALVTRNEQDKPALKKFGLLTRDPRVKERKKPGLRKARRAPQWSKR